MALNWLKPKGRLEEPPENREPEVDVGAAAGPNYDEEFARIREDNEALRGELARMQAYNEGFQKSVQGLNNPVHQQVTQQPQRKAPLPRIDKRKLNEAIIEGRYDEVGDMFDSTFSVYSQRIAELEQGQQVLGGALHGGISIVGNIQESMTKKECPYWDRFKDQIEEQLASLGPGVRAQPGMSKLIYERVVGQNADLLLEEAREEAIRKATGDGDNDPARPSNGSRGSNGSGASYGPGIPPPEAVFAEETIKRLKKDRGMTVEEWCKRAGYKDYPDYIKRNRRTLVEQGILEE